MESILLILIIICVLFTVGVMLGGAATMTSKEPDGRKSNKMMRLRVISQFVSILLILLYIWLRNQG